jgi:hypothetical protein
MANLFQIFNLFVMLFRKNVIEKGFINWRVLPLVKINTYFRYTLYTGCLKKKGPHHNFAIDDPKEKNYIGNEMALKTLQT